MTMIDEPTTAPDTVPAASEAADDPTAGLKLTPRETGAWELAMGIPLDQMPQSYLGALAQWKRAKDRGEPITIDQALDTDWNVIGAELGAAPVDPTPSPGPSTPPTLPGAAPSA